VQGVDEGGIQLQQGLTAGADHQFRVPCPTAPHRIDMVGQGYRARAFAAAVAIGADEIGVAEITDGGGAVALQSAPQIAAGEAQEDGGDTAVIPSR